MWIPGLVAPVVRQSTANVQLHMMLIGCSVQSQNFKGQLPLAPAGSPAQINNGTVNS